MKRIIFLFAFIFVLAMSLASCELILPDGTLPDGVLPEGVLPDGILPDGILPDNSGTENNYDVEAAASYLYNSKLKDYEGKETPNDFELPAKVLRDNVTYTVTWITGNPKVTIKEGSTANFIAIDIPSSNDVAFEYKIIAIVKDPDGKTAVKEVTAKVPVIQAQVGVVDAPVAGVAYKLFLDQKTLERKLYALNTFKSGKLQVTNDAKNAPDYFVEVTTGGYYIYTEVNGVKQYLSVAKVAKPDNSGFYDNVVYTDAATSVWAYDTEFSVWYASIEAETFGLGAYSSNESMGISNISFFKDEAKKDGQYPAKFMTKEYAESLTPDVGVVGPEEPAADSTLTLAQATEFGLKFLHNTYSKNKYYIEGKITNIDNADYGNLIIADDNGGSLTIYGSFINGDKFGQSSNQPKIGDTVKLYGIIGQYSNKAQMKNADIVAINGAAVGGGSSNTPSDISVEDFLAQAFALTDNNSINGPFTFEGVVIGRSTDGYNNVIVALGGHNDKGIMMYKVTDERLVDGATVNFTAGSVKNYKGTIEFMNVTINSINGVAEDNSGADTPGSGSSATITLPDSYKATLDMMGSTNVVEITGDKSVYTANDLTYTNNKASSATANSNYTPTSYAARAYKGSTITLEYAAGFTTVVIVLDDYQSGQYLTAFDDMAITGATVARNNDTVIIVFAQSVTSFTTPELPSQARIETISVA